MERNKALFTVLLWLESYLCLHYMLIVLNVGVQQGVLLCIKEKQVFFDDQIVTVKINSLN